MIIDGVVTCWHCEGSAHDFIYSEGGRSLLECAFCGTMEWANGVFGVNDKSDVFRFDNGRFAGMTIEEVAGSEAGMRYLKAKSSSCEEVATFLAASQAKQAPL